MDKAPIVEHGLYFDVSQLPKLESQCEIAVPTQTEAILNQSRTLLTGNCTCF